jgi:Skp family chaperone for outer membrane proteins
VTAAAAADSKGVESMVVSSRAILAVGLGLVLSSGTAFGQGAAPAGDPAVRKTNTPAASPGPGQTAAVPKPVAAVFGTVDMKGVFDGYDKMKSLEAEFMAAVKSKQGEIAKIQAEAQEEVQKLSKMTPNGVDSKKIEDHLTELKGQLEAKRDNAQRDFTARQADMLSSVYREVQDMVRRIAQYRGMTYVVQTSNEAPSASDPQSVMAAMAKTVVYADPRNDITNDVVHNLNRAYKASGGVAPRAAAPAAGVTPAGN